VLPSEKEENKTVGNWPPQLMQSGLVPHECGIFVRSSAQLNRARAAAEQAGMPFKVLDEHVETTSGHVSISTMHLAKGLEFRAVAVMACDDEIIPLQERIETVGDDADLQDVYDTERQLLYVARTRARDYLLVTSVEPASEFLDDLRSTQEALRS
jgi:superfamily I DNA/RNA helicase